MGVASGARRRLPERDRILLSPMQFMGERPGGGGAVGRQFGAFVESQPPPGVFGGGRRGVTSPVGRRGADDAVGAPLKSGIATNRNTAMKRTAIAAIVTAVLVPLAVTASCTFRQ